MYVGQSSDNNDNDNNSNSNSKIGEVRSGSMTLKQREKKGWTENSVSRKGVLCMFQLSWNRKLILKGFYETTELTAATTFWSRIWSKEVNHNDKMEDIRNGVNEREILKAADPYLLQG